METIWEADDVISIEGTIGSNNDATGRDPCDMIGVVCDVITVVSDLMGMACVVMGVVSDVMDVCCVMCVVCVMMGVACVLIDVTCVAIDVACGTVDVARVKMGDVCDIADIPSLVASNTPAFDNSSPVRSLGGAFTRLVNVSICILYCS